MSINAKISINTLDDFENNYNNMKDQVLSMIHEDFIKEYISFEDLKKSFIPKKKKMIIVKKKRAIKKMAIIVLQLFGVREKKRDVETNNKKIVNFVNFMIQNQKDIMGFFNNNLRLIKYLLILIIFFY